MIGSRLFIRRFNFFTGAAARAPKLLVPRVTVEVQEVERRKPKPPSGESLGFGTVFTDHMLTMAWTKAKGWEPPRIVPHGPLSLEPGATVLQYSQTVFEGMKAVRGSDGLVRVFRPRHNAARLNLSAARACLPEVPEEMFLTGMRRLLQLEQDWVPGQPGTSLYIRPTLIGTEPCFGVRPSESALFYIILSPGGVYFDADEAINLDCRTDYVRAWPGGTGHTKMGANYTSTLLPGQAAQENGCAVNGWLSGDQELLTESGATNIFCFLQKEDGSRVLVTPPLDGLILPGVTRDSVLQLARWGISYCTGQVGTGGDRSSRYNFTVEEKPLPMAVLLCALSEGRLVEMFATGTAATIVSIGGLRYRDALHQVPCPLQGLATTLREELKEVARGELTSPWAVELGEWRLEEDSQVPIYSLETGAH